VALVFEAENCDSYFNQKEGFDYHIGDKRQLKNLQFFVQRCSRRDGGKLIRNSDKNLKGDCSGNFGPCFAPASHGQNNPLLSPSTLPLRHSRVSDPGYLKTLQLSSLEGIQGNFHFQYLHLTGGNLKAGQQQLIVQITTKCTHKATHQLAQAMQCGSYLVLKLVKNWFEACIV
jgi:hypothetical protein